MDFNAFFDSIMSGGSSADAAATSSPAPAAAVPSHIAFPSEDEGAPEAPRAVTFDGLGSAQPKCNPVTIYKGGFGEYSGELIAATEALICYAVRKGSIRVINKRDARNALLSDLCRGQPRDVRAASPGGDEDFVSAIDAEGGLFVWRIDPAGAEGPAPAAAPTQPFADLSAGHAVHAWSPSGKRVVALSEAGASFADYSAGAEGADALLVPFAPGSAGRVAAVAWAGERTAVACRGRGVHILPMGGEARAVELDEDATGAVSLPSGAFAVGARGNRAVRIFKSPEGGNAPAASDSVDLGAGPACAMASCGPYVLLAETDGADPMLYCLFTDAASAAAPRVASVGRFQVRFPVVSIAGEPPAPGAEPGLSLSFFQRQRVQQYRLEEADLAAPAPRAEDAAAPAAAAAAAAAAEPAAAVISSAEEGAGGAMAAEGDEADANADEGAGSTAPGAPVAAERAAREADPAVAEGLARLTALVEAQQREIARLSSLQVSSQGLLEASVSRLVREELQRSVPMALAPVAQQIDRVLAQRLAQAPAAGLAEASALQVAQRVAQSIHAPLVAAFHRAFSEVMLPAAGKAAEDLVDRLNGTLERGLQDLNADLRAKAAANGAAAAGRAGGAGGGGGVRAAILAKVAQRRFEEALQVALQASDIGVVVWLLKEGMDAAAVLEREGPGMAPTVQLCLLQQLFVAFEAAMGGQRGLSKADAGGLFLPLMLTVVRQFDPGHGDVAQHARAILEEIGTAMKVHMENRDLDSDMQTKAEVVHLYCSKRH